MRQSIWCAGLFCLSRSSNHTPETDQRDQMNQLPATRQEIVPGTFSALEPRVGHRLLLVSVAKVQGSLYSPFQSDQPAPVAPMKLP